LSFNKIIQGFFVCFSQVVSLTESPALICKICEKMVNTCAEFKKKCIDADQLRKTQSNERFFWVENLTEIRKYQPIEDEVLTIETMANLENAQPPVPENVEIPLIVSNENHDYDFIDKLSSYQLREMTNEVAKLLTNDFFESEQFQVIRAKVAKKSTTTLPMNASSSKFLQCNKCKARFPDHSKLTAHRHAAHTIKRTHFVKVAKKRT
jgi:hypothetical protein